MMKYNATTMCADQTRLADEMAACEEVGVHWFHWDIMDGHFVGNICQGFRLLEDARKLTTLPFDVHLMALEPERFIPILADLGTDYLTVHFEACTHIDRILGKIRDRGMKCGVALCPHTPASALEYLWDMLDLVVIMTINPGFPGPALMTKMLPKIAAVRDTAKRLGLDLEIQVDGGVNPSNIRTVAEHGCNNAIIGNFFFHHPPYADRIRELDEALA